MEPVIIEYSPDSIQPDSGNVWELIGKEIPRDDPIARDLLPELLEKCRQASTPRAAYRLIKKEELAEKGQVHMGGIAFLVGGTIDKMLRESEYYALFIATAGPGPERIAGEYMARGDYLEGYISNIAGSVLAEAMAEKIHREIGDEAKKRGMNFTNRYSPGYCGWKVDEQQKLFSFFPENSCGISLTESSLMSPIKSVSGLVGLGKNVCFRDYTCELCSMKDCVYRRTGPGRDSLS